MKEDDQNVGRGGDEKAAALTLVVGDAPISISDLNAVARGELQVRLTSSPEVVARWHASRAVVEGGRKTGGTIYGVTTGVGASVDVAVPEELQAELASNLFRFHGCGTGRVLDDAESAAVVVARLATLARGYSGVREEVLQALCDVLNGRMLPRIPAEGSVGASGDLTPLSYLAAALAGERDVTLRGVVMPAGEALERIGGNALVFEPKESLALMNGTGVMTGLGCLALERAERLARWASGLTAIGSDVMHGNPAHFDRRIFELKPHAGTRRVADWIRSDLEAAVEESVRCVARIQDRYSLRCAPHVIGVLVDGFEFAKSLLEIELNGVDDNPIIDPDAGDVLHGGNFYGGHVAFAMDGLKVAIANIADLLDRQMNLLCSPGTSDGLPANLVAVEGPAKAASNGFKAMQISASALTAEALKLTIPASVFSRSTESHNQDKVSMGTIAARDCLRILDLTETVAAILQLAICQAVDLRDAVGVGRRGREIQEAVRKSVPMLTADRRQDLDIEAMLALYRAGGLPVGDLGEPLDQVS